MSPHARVPRLVALAAGSLLLVAASSAGAGPGLPDPFSPNFTDELLDYSNRLAAESRSWFDPPPASRPPPAFHNPYAELSAIMMERMREQNAVFEACAAGDQRACASREAVLDQAARTTRGLATITGIEGAYDHQRELGAQWRRQELYRHSPERGYSASEILR